MLCCVCNVILSFFLYNKNCDHKEVVNDNLKYRLGGVIIVKLKYAKQVDLQEIIRTCIGTGLGIGGIAILAQYTELPFLIAPFGASAVLLYSAASSPLAQPRNLVIGHMSSGFVAITCCRLLGNTVYALVFAVTLAIVVMMLLDAVHPPGGATALLCMLQGTTSYTFLFLPVLIGAMILLMAAIIASHLVPNAKPYPATK